MSTRYLFILNNRAFEDEDDEDDQVLPPHLMNGVDRIYKSDHFILISFYDIRNSSKCFHSTPSFYAQINSLSRIHVTPFENYKATLSNFGDVMNIQQVNDHLCVEYFDTRDAAFAKESLESTRVYDIQVSARFCDSRCPLQTHPDFSVRLEEKFSSKNMSAATSNGMNFSSYGKKIPFSNMDVPKISPLLDNSSKFRYSNPYYKGSQSECLINEFSSRFAINDWPATRREHGIVIPDISHEKSLEIAKNSLLTLDASKIASGMDTRTTFMIKNIPNKYTLDMLIELLNIYIFGKYDFLYLRMDYKNLCNVGYAFINFPNPRDMLKIMHLQGKKWPMFKSEKECFITYAKVQGLDKLIEKFRCSSVMKQPKEFRPRLFSVFGPNSGKEIEFPI